MLVRLVALGRRYVIDKMLFVEHPGHLVRALRREVRRRFVVTVATVFEDASRPSKHHLLGKVLRCDAAPDAGKE
jgi:hypothetical protein